MHTKFAARIAAAAFVAMALTVAALGLREKPAAPLPPTGPIVGRDGDPLALQLRACATMGQEALAHTGCNAAWAEQRRRFLGADFAQVQDPAPAPQAENSADRADTPPTGVR